MAYSNGDDLLHYVRWRLIHANIAVERLERQCEQSFLTFNQARAELRRIKGLHTAASGQRKRLTLKRPVARRRKFPHKAEYLAEELDLKNNIQRSQQAVIGARKALKRPLRDRDGAYAERYQAEQDFALLSLGPKARFKGPNESDEFCEARHAYLKVRLEQLVKRADIPPEYRESVEVREHLDGEVHFYFGASGTGANDHGHYILRQDGLLRYRREPGALRGLQNVLLPSLPIPATIPTIPTVQ